MSGVERLARAKLAAMTKPQMTPLKPAHTPDDVPPAEPVEWPETLPAVYERGECEARDA
jgi:hypothetical protein